MRVALIGDSQSEALWPRVKKLLPSLEFVLTRTQRGWAESHYHNEGKLAQELKTVGMRWHPLDNCVWHTVDGADRREGALGVPVMV